LEAIAVLSKINNGKLDENLEQIIHKVHALDVINSKGYCWRLEVKNELKDGLFWCVERKLFDNYLLQKINPQYTNFLAQTSYLSLQKINDKVLAHLKNKNGEQTVQYDLIIGADGDRSVVKKYLHFNGNQKFKAQNFASVRAYYKGIEKVDSLKFYYLNHLLPGYFWIFPMQNGVFNVGLAVLNSTIEKNKLNLKIELNNIIQQNPNVAPHCKNAFKISETEGWSIPLSSKIEQVYGDNFLLLGDAAHLAEATTGKGIGIAMLSSEIAANTIELALKKNDFSAKTLKNYQDTLHKRHLSTWKFITFAQKCFTFPLIITLFIRLANFPFINKPIQNYLQKAYQKYILN
jgi:flavin-dependent dehydrogenase